MVKPALLVGAPERLLALAADLLLQGDWTSGGKYLDLLDHTQPPIPPDSPLGVRLMVMRATRHGLIGDADLALRQALTARRHAVGAKLDDDDEWITALLAILLRAYAYLEDFAAFDREATAALAMPSLPEPFKLILVRGAQAFAWFAVGRLTDAAAAARGAQADARRLGFEQHPWVVDHLRPLAGVALERRDFDAAEQITERALSISERGRPVFEFLVLLDRAEIWAARGQVHDALATIKAARAALPATTSVLLTQADELEALIRLSLGDLSSPAELARGLPAALRGLLLAKVALAVGDHQTALNHLQPLATADLSPRAALVRQILLAAAAIERGDPIAADILAPGSPDRPPRGLPPHRRHHRAPGNAVPGREHGARRAGAVPRGRHRRGPPGARHPAGHRTTPGRARRAAHRRRAAGPEAAADRQLSADDSHPLHLAQHGEDSPQEDLPQAGRVVALGSDRRDPEAVADAEQLEGLPLEGGGGGDEPEAGQRGVGGGDGVQADGAQVGEQGGEAVHRAGRPGVCLVAALARARGERAAGATGLVRAAWAAGLSSSVNSRGASRACMCQLM